MSHTAVNGISRIKGIIRVRRRIGRRERVNTREWSWVETDRILEVEEDDAQIGVDLVSRQQAVVAAVEALVRRQTKLNPDVEKRLPLVLLEEIGVSELPVGVEVYLLQIQIGLRPFNNKIISIGRFRRIEIVPVAG
jgi:hypothetical protein